ncbi:MAG: DUF6482 family protein [Halieaceae bacterium]|jgi:hypothetical protein|nr:hypothetical protein [Cellvibrionales bacterium]
MKQSLKQLRRQSEVIKRCIIESVDLSLYIAFAEIDGDEHLVAEDSGKILKRHNLLEMKRILRGVADCELVLRQRSAYDEMVGHNHQASANTLEVSLGEEPLPEWLN